MTASPDVTNTNIDSWWDEVVAVALVGTARRSIDPVLAGSMATALGDPSAASGTGQEAGLLDLAAVLGTRRRAGLVVDATRTEPPAPMPVDPRPEAPIGALRLLRVLLDQANPKHSPDAFLIVHWLRRAADRGYRLPVADLPALAARATLPGAADMRRALIGVGGAPLEWLAQHNRRWSWAAGHFADRDQPKDGDQPTTGDSDWERLATQWRTGRSEQRMNVLRAVHRRDPAAARRLIESTRKGDKAADRAEAISVLAEAPNPDDEALLESALDDRAATVQIAAGRALSRLRGTARSRRMDERLAELVRFDGPLRRRITVDAPEVLDDAARRDGITDTLAPPGVDIRTSWALQIVEGASLQVWRDLGLPAAQVAEMLSGEPRTIAALSRVAERERDAVWASALAQHDLRAGLVNLLSREESDRLIRARLIEAADKDVESVLVAAPVPWSLALSIEAVERLRAVKVNRVASAAGHSLYGSCERLSMFGHFDVQPHLEAWISRVGSGEHLYPTLRAAINRLSLRRAIYMELP